MSTMFPGGTDNFGTVTGGEATIAPNTAGLTQSGVQNLMGSAVTELETWLLNTGSRPGYQVMTAASGVSLGGNAGTITETTITNAISAGYTGLFVDPRYVWNFSPIIYDVQDFVIESLMIGSIGWLGNVVRPVGYFYTGTGADGVQIYGASGNETQGIKFKSCAFVGANTNAVVHAGGRQRDVSFEGGCYFENTLSLSSAIGAGSIGVNVNTFTGSGTLAVTSSTGFISGTVIVPTNAGTNQAVLAYTGVSGGNTLTGVTTVSGSGTVASGNAVALGHACIVDTLLTSNIYNSEDMFFMSPQFVSKTFGLGIGVGDYTGGTQHANDSLVINPTFSCGIVSLYAASGSNWIFHNFYDRGAPSYASVYNNTAQIVLDGGEGLNNATTNSSILGLEQLIDGATGATVIQNRTISTGSNGNNTVNIINGGSLSFRGRTKPAGTIYVGGSARLDVSDPLTSTQSTVLSGSAGTVWAAPQYNDGNAPSWTAFTGSIILSGVPPITVSSPAQPSTTTSTTAVMAGLTSNYTQLATMAVLVNITGQAGTSTGIAVETIEGYYGAYRTDTATVTNTSATVTDASILATDLGRHVTGTGIPANTYVGTVTPGTSFLMSSSPTSQSNVTATAGGTSRTLAGYGNGVAQSATVSTAFGQGAITIAPGIVGTRGQFVIVSKITSLSVNVKYWFDLSLFTSSGSDAAGLNNLYATFQECN